MQEFQNEMNCIHDSRDFQDADSTQWTFPRKQSFCVLHASSNTGRDVETFFRNAVPQRRAAKHLGQTWQIGKRFCKSRCVILSFLSSGIESMEFQKRRNQSLINGGEEWETNPNSRPEVCTSSQLTTEAMRWIKEDGHRYGKAPENREYLVHNLKKRCIKRVFSGIHDRFLQDHVFRERLLEKKKTRLRCLS